MPYLSRLPPDRVMGIIESSLSDDLLRKDWLERRKPTDHPTFGHCYVATEALWHLWGKYHGYRPWVVNEDGYTHWYLVDDEGDVKDPTKGQRLGREVPYETGRRNGFLTKRPSRRCRTVMRRVVQSSS
jgi:hypothetical protein